MQNLQQSSWDHEILFGDRYSEDEQLLVRTLLRESKSTSNSRNTLRIFFILFNDIFSVTHVALNERMIGEV
jgi:hypothetical protein